ncbi:unnamed protein product [Lampetra planeri]
MSLFTGGGIAARVGTFRTEAPRAHRIARTASRTDARQAPRLGAPRRRTDLAAQVALAVAQRNRPLDSHGSMGDGAVDWECGA